MTPPVPGRVTNTSARRPDPPSDAPARFLNVAAGLRLHLRGASSRSGPVDLRVAAIGVVRFPEMQPFEALDAGGRPWRRVWLCADRMVVEFLGIASAEVHADGSIVFDRELPPDLEDHLVLDHLLALELARRGEIVLHGAVVGLDDRAAVLVGRSGAGKSTLTAFAWQHGWTVGGDDGAVLRMTPQLMVEPTYPTVRLTPDATDLLGVPLDDTTAVAGKRRLADGGSTRPFRTDAAPLCLVAVVEPAPAEAPARFGMLSGVDAHVALFRHVFHAALGEGRLTRDVVDRLVPVVESVTVGRLFVPRGRPGLAAAEEVLRREISR